MAVYPMVPFWSLLSFINDSDIELTSGVRLEDIESWSGNLIADKEPPESYSGTPYQNGDILFGKLRPYLAKSWLATGSGAAVGDIHVYRPNPGQTEPRFLAYIVRTPQFISYAEGSSEGVKMPRCEWSKLRQFPTPFPDLDTQRRIADYLDAETAQIDALVAELDGYVELLEKRKSEVVKKHFSETQFPAVPLFTFVGMKSGDGISPEKQGDLEIPVYGGNGIMGSTATPNRLHDSIVIGRVGALCGNVHLAKAPFFVSDNALVVDIQSEVNLSWLVYSLRNLNLRDLSQSSAQPVITASKVLRQRVNLPPLDKQEEIAHHITQELARTDTIITECRELKELLLKRRQVLITDVVTGQVEV